MEPQTPTTIPEPTDTPIPPKLVADNHGITIFTMALFVLGSLAVVVFLYYQNQQLKDIVASYQVQTTNTPSPTTTPVTTPSGSASPTPKNTPKTSPTLSSSPTPSSQPQ